MASRVIRDGFGVEGGLPILFAFVQPTSYLLIPFEEAAWRHGGPAHVHCLGTAGVEGTAGGLSSQGRNLTANELEPSAILG
jgi:hypothetical protein